MSEKQHKNTEGSCQYQTNTEKKPQNTAMP